MDMLDLMKKLDNAISCGYVELVRLHHSQIIELKKMYDRRTDARWMIMKPKSSSAIVIENHYHEVSLNANTGMVCPYFKASFWEIKDNKLYYEIDGKVAQESYSYNYPQITNERIEEILDIIEKWESRLKYESVDEWLKGII